MRIYGTPIHSFFQVKKSSKQGEKFKVRAKGGLLLRVCFHKVGQSRLITQMKVIPILVDIHELQSINKYNSRMDE
jgi:hypothetical protein